MKKIAIVALLSSTVMSSATFAADQGFYVGANLGQASTDYNNLSTKTGTAFTVLGGYQINKNFAVEAQYGDFGSITPIGGTSVKISEYGAAAVGILPINAQWSAYGKLGFASTSLKLPGRTASNTGATLGIGGQFNVNQQLGIRFGYDSYKVGDTQSQTATTGVISAGVVYKF